MKLRPLDDVLMEQLTDRKFATEYIRAVAEEGDPKRLAAAIGDVVKAKGGIAKMAREAGLNRPNLQNSLTGKGNPSLAQITLVLDKLGLVLAVAPKKGKRAA